MRKHWDRITLMRHATEEDDGRIPPRGWLGTFFVAVVIWVVWTLAQWAVQN
tara:strand:+ start:255 stop:407 length:153 start_codon:yes stop_codon:yes gene_type:complete